MPATRFVYRVGVVLSGTIMMSGAGHAQSRETGVLERSSLTVAREYVATGTVVTEQTNIPQNFSVSPIYRSLVDLMLKRSATFQMQCARIANARELHVVLQAPQQPMRSGARSITHVRRYSDGQMIALVEIPVINNQVELIAHEVEHILEQLDEINLSAVAARRNSGVHRLQTGVFETVRATRTGIAVADEVR
jgi:hypothetical protein